MGMKRRKRGRWRGLERVHHGSVDWSIYGQPVHKGKNEHSTNNAV